ncbi:MAG: type II toxin-antitoxin system VapC family toxin [Polyangiaceae bacterium]
MMFLLDTNTLIYFFKGKGRVAQRLLATPPSETAVSSITVYEIDLGIAKSRSPDKRRAQLSTFLSYAKIVSFGRMEAAASADIRAALETKGTPIGPLDTLLAGTARAHGTVFVTHNVREFRRVQGLQVVDWY